MLLNNFSIHSGNFELFFGRDKLRERKNKIPQNVKKYLKRVYPKLLG